MDNTSQNHVIKVLLVEDSPTDARLLLHELKGMQGALFEVTWVELLSDALAKIHNTSFDVALLDLTLPDSSGMATFTRILESSPLLPVVVLTGMADESVGVEAIRHGVQDYLVKGDADGKTVARAIRYAVERKSAEDALRQSDARFRQLAEAASEGLLIHDNGQILDVNSPLAEILGYTIAELHGKSFYDFINPRHRDLLKEDSIAPITVEAVRKDGIRIPIEVMLKPFMIGEKQVQVAAIRNIMERTRMEEQRKHLAEELRHRVEEVQATNTALQESQKAAFNLMDDALAARKQVEQANEELVSLSEQRGIALEMQKKLVMRLDILSKTASELLQSHEPLALVEFLCRKVMEHLDCQVFFNFLVNENENKLHLNAWAGIPEEEAKRIEWLDFGTAVCGCAARDGARIVTENIQTTLDVRTDLVKSYGVTAYACHPILGPDEKILGTLSFGTKNHNVFADDDLSLMKAVTDQMAIAITRRNNELDLLRSREEWVETFNVIPDHIAILDNRHRIVRANKAMAERLGFSPNEVIGKPCHICVHNSSTPISNCPHSQLLKDGKEHISEIYEDKLGGNFLVSVTPIFDENGNVKGGVHVARDITERKKREEELYKLNRTLEALSKSSQAMTRTSDEQEFLDEVCRIVVEDCGYAMVWIGFAENDEKKSVRPVAHSGFEDGYLSSLKISWGDTELGLGPTGTAIRTGSISRCRNMQTDPAFLPWRDEAIKRGYASSICIPLIMYGKSFGAITIYAQQPDAFSESEARLLVDLANDLAYGITSIRLRAAQSKAEESLRNEHNFINTILQTTGGLIMGLDPEGRIKIFNHSCERVSGYLFADIKDKVFWNTLLIPEEIAMVKEVFYNISHMPKQTEYENYWVSRDGNRRFIRWTYSAVIDKNGNAELIIGTGIDITERKQAEIELEQYRSDLERLVMVRTAALRASEEQLMKANEMKLLGQLTSGVAHEVRNPLNGIVAIMGALAKELSGNEHFQPYVQHMHNQVNRLTVLMEDLLMLGRPITREGMVDLQLDKLVRTALASWQQGLQGQREVVVLESPAADTLMIRAEPIRLEQMIVNLLDNAHQHTPAGKTLEITIRNDENNGVVFAVRDNGPGIQPDVMPRIFEPFFTTRKGGTGLGLSIVRHIVESHGGSIKAFNNENSTGSTFQVTFPPKPAESV